MTVEMTGGPTVPAETTDNCWKYGEENGSYEGELAKQYTPLTLDNCLAPPSFNKVDITSSQDIHIGNKIILNGVVHINQLVGEQEKPTLVPPPPPTCITCPKEAKARKSSQLILEHKILILSLSLVVIGCIAGAVIYFRPASNEDMPVTGTTEIISSGFNKLKIRPRVEWLAQPPNPGVAKLKLPAPLVIITHTASEGCTTHPECMLIVRNIQMLHMEGKKFSDIGYNFLVGGDGYVYEGRGWDKEGAHTFGFNVHSIGIALVGTFNEIRPPEKQFLATQQLISQAVLLGKISENYQLVAHCNVSKTASPGAEVYKEIKKWPHFTQVAVVSTS